MDDDDEKDVMVLWRSYPSDFSNDDVGADDLKTLMVDVSVVSSEAIIESNNRQGFTALRPLGASFGRSHCSSMPCIESNTYR